MVLFLISYDGFGVFDARASGKGGNWEKKLCEAVFKKQKEIWKLQAGNGCERECGHQDAMQENATHW